MTVDDYLALITSQHRGKAKFEATVTAIVEPYVELQALRQSLPAAFDIDAAVGVQLDAVGVWVGRSRHIDTPLEGVYFAWDDTDGVGWESGVWKGPYDPDSGLVDLPDDAYRLLLRAKIAANRWDGTIPGAYDIWETVFTGSTLVVQDGQDMSMVVGIVGQPLSAVDLALLVRGFIPLKPAGVRIQYYATVPAVGPMFAWDVDDTDTLAGWGDGQWSYELNPV